MKIKKIPAVQRGFSYSLNRFSGISPERGRSFPWTAAPALL